MKKQPKYSSEVIERAVRMVSEASCEYESQWADVQGRPLPKGSNQDVMARQVRPWQAKPKIHTGSVKLEKVFRNLPAYSIRDRGGSLDRQSGSMAAIFTCLTSSIESLAK